MNPVDAVKAKVEQLNRKYPAADLGLTPGSYDYWTEVLREAQEQTT